MQSIFRILAKTVGGKHVEQEYLNKTVVACSSVEKSSERFKRMQERKEQHKDLLDCKNASFRSDESEITAEYALEYTQKRAAFFNTSSILRDRIKCRRSITENLKKQIFV